MLSFRGGINLKEYGSTVPVLRSGAANTWWLDAGITPIAAYQGIGATDYTSSLINLANPGLYDLIPIAAPTWDVNKGWCPEGDNNKVFLCGFAPNNLTWTAIARVIDCNNASGFYYFGSYDATARFTARHVNATTHSWRYGTGDIAATVAVTADSTVGMLDGHGYIDGVQRTVTAATRIDSALTEAGLLGYSFLGSRSGALPAGSYIAAAIWFNQVITLPQYQAAEAAMKALTASTPPF